MALSSITALSSSTNTNSTKAPTVKQERHDEAEIRELAAKMLEANKAKAASSLARQNAQNSLQQLVHAGQPGIMNFVSRLGASQIGAAKVVTGSATNTDADKKPPSDEDSARGKFGWTTLGKCYIPYIFRNGGEKYCAVRMVELKLLNKYLSYLHADIYSCTCIRSYYITDVEAKLLHEINVRHCDSLFGREPFTSKDLVVRLQDAEEFYHFLDVCYNKLLLCSNNPQDKCGFIRINGESVVPYTVRDNVKYVPLFYFEGETDNLKLKAEKLEGWDLAYLKFCCKVQGIRNELFAHETCSVISLGDIKSYFPPGTQFEDYWPSKVMDSQLLLTTNKANMSPMSAGMWTNKPKVPPPSPNTTTHQTVTSKASMQATAAQLNGWSGLAGGQQYPTGQLVRMAHPPTALQRQINASNNMQNNVRNFNNVPSRHRMSTPYTQYGPSVTLALASTQPNHMTSTHPPPLVRTAAGPMRSVPTYASAAAAMSLPSVSPNAASMHHLSLPSSPHHQMLPPHPHYVNQVSSQQRHTPPTAATNNNKYPAIPPPLIPVNGATGAAGVRYATYSAPSVAAGGDVMDLSAAQQQQQQPAHTNGRTGGNDLGKLIQIGETATSGSHIPYQVQKALVEGNMVPCINSKPFIYTELLMTLTDLVGHFFPAVSMSSCTQVLQDVLRINLYRGNRQQMTILRDSGKCQSTLDLLPLIQVRDVMKFMPQMKYMFNRASLDTSPPAKRARLS